MSDYVGDNAWIPKGGADADTKKLVWSTKQVDGSVSRS